jgi:hypothetical protein
MNKKLKRLIENGYSYEAQAIIKDGVLMYQIEILKKNKQICSFIEEENLNFDELVIERIIQHKREYKIDSILQ